jgi:hypothetical protein
MIVSTTPERANAVLRAMRTVATAGGSEPMSNADRRGIAAAYHTVFGLDGEVEPDGLENLAPGDAATSIVGDALRFDAVKLLAVMALVDAVVDQTKLQLVVDFARALDVDEDFVTDLHHLLDNDIKWTAIDLLRHNIATIPGMTFEPGDPFSAFLPFRDGHGDPALVARYEQLSTHPSGTLGRAFYDHYKDNGFAFPGEEWGVGEPWGTPHDCMHILSGYSTSPQGELLVAVFNGGMIKRPDEMMSSHVLPVILTYHMGIELNKGINKGDRQRFDRDPSWRDNYEGNVHLGLDPAKLWVAWERGKRTTQNLFDGEWSLWDNADERVDDLRVRYEIPALRPEDAALPDGAIDRDDFVRPGQRLPEMSTEQVAERPSGD